MKPLFESVELVPQRISVNGTIKKVINLYKELKVPMRALISDYYAVMDKKNNLADAENPWAYYHAGIQKETIETGVSTMETAFIFGAMELVKKKQAPTAVINAAFYSNQARNDSAFEMSFLLPLFLKETVPTNKILIVNPTPDIIIFTEQNHPGNKVYLVTDEIIAKLYKMEFPESEFFSFEQTDQVKDIDRMLIINRDQKKSKATELLKSLQCCKSNSSAIMCIPSSWFDSSSSTFSNLSSNNFAVETIVILDTAATASSPKKRC